MSESPLAFLRDQAILAPLTKGGNLPFRRLCVGFGARVTMSEMAMARNIVRGQRSEFALLRKADEERHFGVQFADKDPEQLVKAARIAVERGAAFIDINLGCPIDEFCRRGLGAALMRRPRRVADLVRALRTELDVPVTVKMRLGWSEEAINYREVATAAVEAGAQAVTLHGRSRRQRYRRAADWDAVAELVRELPVLVIGNGDLLTHRDVAHRRAESGCAAVMLGRAALIKPWVFAEVAEQRDYLLDRAARYAVLELYRDLALAHFGEDERGRTRARQFLLFHLDFWNRYRPIDSSEIDLAQHPLIQTRDAGERGEGEFAILDSADARDYELLAERLMAEFVERGGGPTDAASVGTRCRAILDSANGNSPSAPHGDP